MQKKWSETSGINRFAAAVALVAGIAVIVLAAVQLLDLWEGAINVYMPLLGVINLCHAVGQWKTSRKMACLSLVVAVVIFICSAVVWLG